VRRCEATPGFTIENLDQFKDFLRAATSIFPDNRHTFERVKLLRSPADRGREDRGMVDHMGQHVDPGPAGTSPG
jgi:hypothetical protein